LRQRLPAELRARLQELKLSKAGAEKREMGHPVGLSADAGWRRFRYRASAFVKGILRRQMDNLLPNREAAEYKIWINERLKERQARYRNSLEAGLLGVLTPVWNGSPARHLKALAKGLIAQNRDGACEWVILDNGCSKPSLLACLEELRAYSWVKLDRVERNIGITGGLRHCLEQASAQYILPVDADDCLYPDALKIVASHVQSAGYPPLLYSDEDKLAGTRFYQPYMKPDWDPVLLLNSAYVAHLGVVDRLKAIELGAYSDPAAEGSPDWDLFIRFLMAGHTAVHIPTVLYSWRAHADSTADDAATKPYIHSSQRAVLQRFLDARPDRERFRLELSPLLGGAPHWHFLRQPVCPRPLRSMVIGDLKSEAWTLAGIAQEIAAQDGLLHFIGEGVEIDDAEWPWEAQGLFELHPDTVMIGGRIRNRKGTITEAGRYFGFGGICGCPDRGRPFLDPGYFGQMFKQRSVSAVSTQFAVVRAAFLVEVLAQLPEGASLAFLGAWAGAHALRTGRRIVYTPFLSGISDMDWDSRVEASEQSLFAERNRDIIPDQRFYSRSLSLTRPFALRR